MSVEEQVLGWLAKQGPGIYLVGGCVRDRLMGRSLYDLDVAVLRGGLALARRLANRFQGAYFALDAARDTGRAIIPTQEGLSLVVDVTGFRGPDLAADLADRDFTINALAADVRTPDRVIDHHGGLADLQAGIIRPVSESSIRDDPLRALRAIRQASELGFTLAPDTEVLIRRDGRGLARISSERVRDELARMLAQSNSAHGLIYLDRLGLLTIILPELESLRGLDQPRLHHLDGLAHSLETVRALEDILTTLAPGGGGVVGGQSSASNAVLESLGIFAGRLHAHLDQTLTEARSRGVTLKLAALLHDTGKPAARALDDAGQVRFIGHPKEGARDTRDALRRLRFSRAEVHLGETIVRHHMRPLLLAEQKSVSSRAIYRFFRDTQDAGVEVLLHALADHRATFPVDDRDDRWSRLVALTARMLTDYWERRAERVAPSPLIDGHDLVHEFGLQPGPHIGELLEDVREAQVSGEVQTREEALGWIGVRLRGSSGQGAD